MHDMWVVTDRGVNRAIQAIFAERPLFIADGHHRYETALAYKEERARTEGEVAVAGWNYVMMFPRPTSMRAASLSCPRTGWSRPPERFREPDAFQEAVGEWYAVEESRIERGGGPRVCTGTRE